MTRMNALLAAATALFLTAPLLATSRDATHSFSHQVDGMQISRIVVELPVSELEIRSSRGRDLIVEGTASRSFSSLKEKPRAQNIADQTDVEIVIRGRSAHIRPKLGPDARSRFGRRNSAQLKVSLHIPSNLDLTVKQRAGSVNLDGAFGNVEIDTRVGEVVVVAPKRSVRELIAHARIGEVKTNVGDRTVIREGFFPGTTHYLNEGGRGVLKVSVGVGDISVELVD